MTMLVQYDRARAALAEATQVGEVLAIRDELAHVKLYARQIRDRALMADASEFQMRAERRLGFLLTAAKEAGELLDGRPRKRSADDTSPAPAKLSEIGVDRVLSSKAQKAAAIEEQEFELIVTEMRDRMRSGKAIILDPVEQADKAAKVDARRAAHTARTLTGGCVKDLHQLVAEGKKFRTFYSDPQWKFLTRSAEGDGRSANVHYTTEKVDEIKALPIQALAEDDSSFLMWMVDWCVQDALDLLTHYGFKHVTNAFTWAKENPGGDGWHMGMGYWTRANPEQCWLATRGNPKRLYADVRQLIVAPVMEHSRKPDEAYERIERLVEGPYLELQARRPRAGWTSWGNELEFTGEAA